MQIKREQISPTSVKLTISAPQGVLDDTKQAVLKQLARDAKVTGFRPGKAPVNLVEKQLDPSALQTEFLDRAVNQLYVDAIKQEKLRPVAQPEISVTKFVPYNTLEFTAEVESVGDIELANYKKIKLSLPAVTVTAKDVDDVVNNLRRRAAAKEPVDRAAKTGDEVTLNFKGTDAKSGEPIEGADGQDYPLELGSQTFIPGFEEKVVGIKPDGQKTFTITFPKDYNVAALQNREVKFEVTAIKVQALKLPKLDNAFAATIGPFKTLAELKTDIKKQLKVEKQQEANRTYDNQMLEKIAAASTVPIPAALIEEEIDRLEEEEKRNITYRGQTWQEHLDAEGITAEAHREQKRHAAENRVKAGLVLGEIAERERVTVTPEELEIRVQLLKGQYPDPAMQAELDKPENRRDIASRMMTEKTLDILRSSANK